MNNDFNKQRLFNNIGFLLKEKNMKIGELEAAAGVSTGFISRGSKEDGPTPGIEFIFNAAKALSVSMDTLVTADLQEMSATERYVVSFLEKLLKDTEEDRLAWNCESCEYLERVNTYGSTYGSAFNSTIPHELFSYEEFFEEDIDGNLVEKHENRFVSHTFDVYTAIDGDCFNVKLRSDVTLYIMIISKSANKTDERNPFAKEIWLSSRDLGQQYLCSNRDCEPIGQFVEDIYISASESSKKPQIKKQFKDVMDAYMRDEPEDDEEYNEDFDADLPF